MPVVTDCPYPKALPIAITPSPTLTLSESPNVAFLIFFNTSDGMSFNFTATTATSFVESVPLMYPSTESFVLFRQTESLSCLHLQQRDCL